MQPHWIRLNATRIDMQSELIEKIKKKKEKILSMSMMIVMFLIVPAVMAWLESAASASLKFTTLHDAFSPKSSPQTSAWPVGAVAIALENATELCEHVNSNGNASASWHTYSVDLIYCQISAAQQLASTENVTVSQFRVNVSDVNAGRIGPILFFMGSAERRAANIEAYIANATNADLWLALFCAQSGHLFRGMAWANGMFLSIGLCDSNSTSQLVFVRNVTELVSTVRATGEAQVWATVQTDVSNRPDSAWMQWITILFSTMTLVDDDFVAPKSDPADWGALFNASQRAAFRTAVDATAVDLAGNTSVYAVDIDYWWASHAIVTSVAPLVEVLFALNESQARQNGLFKRFASPFTGVSSPLETCSAADLFRFVGTQQPNATSTSALERSRADLWNTIVATKRFICQVFLDLAGVLHNETIIPSTTTTTTAMPTKTTTTMMMNTTSTTNMTTSTTVATTTTPTTTTTKSTPMPTSASSDWSRQGAIAGAMRSVLKWVDLMHCSANGTVGCGSHGVCQPWSLVTHDLAVTSIGCSCEPGFTGSFCQTPPPTMSRTMTTSPTTTPPPTTPLPTTVGPTPLPTTSTTVGTMLNLLCPNGCSHLGLCNSVTGLCTCDLVPGSKTLHFAGPDCSSTPCNSTQGCAAVDHVCDEAFNLCRKECLLPRDCGNNAVCFRPDTSPKAFCRCVDAFDGANCTLPVPTTTTKPSLLTFVRTTLPTTSTTTAPTTSVSATHAASSTIAATTTVTIGSTVLMSQTTAPPDSDTSVATLAISLCGAAVVLAAVVLFAWWWKKRRVHGYERMLSSYDSTGDDIADF
jgi:hypothetical protein